MGIVVAVAIRGIPDEEVLKLVHTTYGAFIQPGQEDDIVAYVAMLKAHGPALMGVFALRTLVRFIGTLRMWQGFKDGFHIYTTAQLLGMLVPMLIAGPKAINLLGFVLALNWCYLYFTHRKALR